MFTAPKKAHHWCNVASELRPKVNFLPASRFYSERRKDGHSLRGQFDSVRKLKRESSYPARIADIADEHN